VKKTGDQWQACLLFISKNAELGKLATLVKPLSAPRTFVWVNVKVASFSETHTALKFTARRQAED